MKNSSPKIDWHGLYRTLSSDLRAINVLFESGNNEMARRIFATYAFTTFESTSRILVAQVNAAVIGGNRGRLDDKRIKSARESESQEVRTLPHLLFALKCVSLLHGTKDFEPSKVDLWKSVEQSKNMRDRVVHPKTLQDLQVTREEHIECKCALAWLMNCLTFAQTFEENPGISFAEAENILRESLPTKG